MRRICLLLPVFVAIAACGPPPPPAAPTPQAQAQLQQLVAGKVAQQPVSCLPHYNADDMVIIDQNTVAFRSGGTVYVNHMNGPCSNLGGAGGYALLTRNTAGLGLCSGDIARVVDTTAHITVGSCSFGEFVPFVAPR